MQKSNVYYFVAHKGINIVSEIKNDNSNLFKCYGTGSKAYKTACKNATNDELVHQVKITTDSIQLLYSY